MEVGARAAVVAERRAAHAAHVGQFDQPVGRVAAPHRIAPGFWRHVGDQRLDVGAEQQRLVGQGSHVAPDPHVRASLRHQEEL